MMAKYLLKRKNHKKNNNTEMSHKHRCVHIVMVIPSKLSFSALYCKSPLSTATLCNILPHYIKNRENKYIINTYFFSLTNLYCCGLFTVGTL